MKGILDSTNNMSTKRFLEKFLSKKKDYNDEKDNILNNKSISKYNISDYHSTNWLEKFNEKKKDKFYYKAIEDINKIKASRNNSRKLTNKSNLINSYTKKYNVNSLKQKNYFTQRNNKDKKNYSLKKKKNVNQMKLIKNIKEDLKNNPQLINKKLIFDKNNENDTKKMIKNIKIERVISHHLNKKKSSQSLKINASNKNENLSNISNSKTEISNNINSKNNKKKRINFYHKFKSQSGDLNKSLNNSQSKNIKKNLIKQIKIEKNLKKNSFLTENSNNSVYNNTERNENKRFISKIKKKLDFNKENEKEKRLYYKNMKIKIQENIQKRKSKKINKNKLHFSNLEIINSITTVKLKDNNKGKNSQLFINRPFSVTDFSSKRVNSLKNKYRDLICEYESEIDS